MEHEHVSTVATLDANRWFVFHGASFGFVSRATGHPDARTKLVGTFAPVIEAGRDIAGSSRKSVGFSSNHRNKNEWRLEGNIHIQIRRGFIW